MRNKTNIPRSSTVIYRQHKIQNWQKREPTYTSKIHYVNIKSSGANFLTRGKKLFTHNTSSHEDPKIMKRMPGKLMKGMVVIEKSRRHQ
jgi:hypothetical protein